MLTEKNELELTVLREKIRGYMGEKRLSHTLAVERETGKLAELYAPDKEYELRAAALLHDVTKELSHEKQLELCRMMGVAYSFDEMFMPKIFHARTAPIIIKRDFPEFATDTVLGAVRWHTTGHEAMTVTEQILFLADFIEDTRTFESCIALRKFFWDGIAAAESEDKRLAHLTDTMIFALDTTIRELCEDKMPIHEDTVAARNSFIIKKGAKK